MAALWPPALYPGPYNGIEASKPPYLFLPLYLLEDWISLYALLLVPPIIFIALFIIPFVDHKISTTSTVHRVIVVVYLAILAAAFFSIVYVGFAPPVNHMEMMGKR